MDFSRMKQRITIEKSSVVKDAVGNHRSAWTEYFSCFAYASTFEAKESEGEVTTEERSVTFEVRYCHEVAGLTSTGFRIRFDGELYSILSIDLMNYDHKSVKLHCKREVRA